MSVIGGYCLDYCNRSFFTKLLLSLSWLFGLPIGALVFALGNDSVISLMRSVLVERSSIVSLLTVLTFPLLLSALLVLISKPSVVILLAFLKAIIFGFTAFSISRAFGDAGWLSRWLLLFSDSCCVAVLLWFWFRNIIGKTDTFKTDLLISLTLAVLFGCFDYYLVSPLSGILFN